MHEETRDEIHVAGIQRTLSPLVGDTATEIDRDIVKEGPHRITPSMQAIKNPVKQGRGTAPARYS
eukprot:1049464-Amphidinium_carterae.2